MSRISLLLIGGLQLALCSGCAFPVGGESPLTTVRWNHRDVLIHPRIIAGGGMKLTPIFPGITREAVHEAMAGAEMHPVASELGYPTAENYRLLAHRDWINLGDEHGDPIWGRATYVVRYTMRLHFDASNILRDREITRDSESRR